MRAQQRDHVHAICFNMLSHMITIMAMHRVAVQRQRVAEAAMKTFSYEDISVILSE